LDGWLVRLLTHLLRRADAGLGLSESGDRQQLEGLGRLARALSAGANQPAQNGAASPAQQQQQQQRWWSMQQSAAILNWLVEVRTWAPLLASCVPEGRGVFFLSAPVLDVESAPKFYLLCTLFGCWHLFCGPTCIRGRSLSVPAAAFHASVAAPLSNPSTHPLIPASKHLRYPSILSALSIVLRPTCALFYPFSGCSWLPTRS
jgi:hypothetical protein